MYLSFCPGYLLIFSPIYIYICRLLVHYFIYLFFCPFICLFIYLSVCSSICLGTRISIYLSKVVMKGKFFQKCTHLLYIKKINEIFWSLETIVWIIKIIKFNAFNLLGYLTNTEASILVNKFRPERIDFNMYAEYTRPQLFFLAFHPLIHPIIHWINQ